MEEELFTNGSSYLESLCKALKIITDIYNCNSVEYKQMNKLVKLELDLAIMGAEKAKEKLTKKSGEIKEIKR